MKNICWIVLSIFMTMSCSKQEFEKDVVVYVPNSFSPNRDNINETITVTFGDSLAISDFRSYLFFIYDTHGGKVYSSNDIGHGWDGKVNYHTVTGLFIWKLNFTLTKENKEYFYQGTVSITN